MAVKTDTLLMLGGLAVLGVGMFYFLNKDRTAMALAAPTAVGATDAAAADLGVSNQAQYNQMLMAMQQAMQGIQSGQIDKKQAQAQITAQYVQMGLGAASTIASSIAQIVQAL